MAEENFLRKSLKIALVVALYWFTSIAMVFFNKRLLNSDEIKLNAPIFVTFFQCFVAVILCQTIAFFAKFKRGSTFPTFKFDQKVSREVLPVSICFVSMITFNNLSLRDLGVPFYNVGRSLTTLFNVILSYFILKKTTSPLALVCCGIIMLGYMLGINIEGDLVNLSYIGCAYGAIASFFVSLNAIFTSRVLPAVENNLWKLGYYNNLNSCVLLLPALLLSNDLYTVYKFPDLANLYLWGAFILVGIFGFMTGFVSTWQIQVTTPLTHNISGTAKACAQTILAVGYYHTPKTALWWLSNMMVLAGSFFYTVVRRNQMKHDHDEKVQFEREKQKSGLRLNV
uniref:GDP-fucose transporter 1 n=1 Tax=Phallusia mammillata TaxID=59560 RepID=A0A6F9DS10_9ASCI|nr:GDP-fucose transporter 1 [Phallusia mammillata]